MDDFDDPVRFAERTGHVPGSDLHSRRRSRFPRLARGPVNRRQRVVGHAHGLGRAPCDLGVFGDHDRRRRPDEADHSGEDAGPSGDAGHPASTTNRLRG